MEKSYYSIRTKKRCRIIVPDLVGLGLSDKLDDPKLVGSLKFHIDIMEKLINALQLKNLTIVAQELGGPISAGIAERNPSLIKAVVFANTVVMPPPNYSSGFFNNMAQIPILGDIIVRLIGFPIPLMQFFQGDRKSIGKDEKRAYYFPFRNWHDSLAALEISKIVPSHPNHRSVPIMEATEKWAKEFRGNSALVWGNSDPILGRSLRRMKSLFPNAIVVETEAGHFLQEEVPEVLSSTIEKVTFKD